MAQASIKRASEPTAIPDRLYFKIGDVARICGVETYVLRFWESQFPQLKPNKSGTGQRLYRKRDVELALEIKKLVHAEGYTIAGARQALDTGHRRRSPEPAAAATNADQAEPVNRRDAVAAVIGHARAELREIAAMLAAPEPKAPRPRGRLMRVSSKSGNLFPV
jgi:DNA-binding transcriptional MerR regulator